MHSQDEAARGRARLYGLVSGGVDLHKEVCEVDPRERLRQVSDVPSLVVQVVVDGGERLGLGGRVGDDGGDVVGEVCLEVGAPAACQSNLCLCALALSSAALGRRLQAWSQYPDVTCR